MVKKIKKIKRKRGKSTLYFSPQTQESIQEFQNCESLAEKEKLYVEHIFPAFDKLAENLIFVYGFITPMESYQVLKSDCVSFLYETLEKWDSSRGTKAFSYFNVVAKNWLIMHTRKLKKRTYRHASLDDTDSMSKTDQQLLANFDFAPPPDEILINKNFRNEIFDILKTIKTRVRGEKEVRCINSIETVFSSIDDLEFLNKRAIFVYVRNISGLNPKQLSVAMSSIRKHYKEIIKEKIREENK